MNHSGVLSRVFWPTHDGAQVRGEFIRTVFGIADDSPSNAKNRRVRNTIEHWDERLDVDGWHQRITSAGQHGGLWIGPVAQMESPGSYTVRGYDPATDLVVSGHDRMPMQPLVTAVARVRERYDQVVNFLHDGLPIWYWSPVDTTLYNPAPCDLVGLDDPSNRR